jgi:hypothetical protein
MGLDMWLPSKFDYNSEQHVDRVLDGLKGGVCWYEALQDTGGYYREAYNGSGLLSLLGISWSKIMDDLPDRNRLPPVHARHLLAELEAKPFTPAMLLAERHAHPAVKDLTGPTPQQTKMTSLMLRFRQHTKPTPNGAGI